MEKDSLNQKQELFCRYYTENSDSFGNATLSYKLAYQKDSKPDKSDDYCGMAGSRLIGNDRIKARIETLLQEQFDTDSVSDSRLMQIIVGGKDSDAINAIKHRNDLKQRITKRVELKTIDRPLTHLSDEELMAMTAGLEIKELELA
ncbi:MAG TPA: terminase small subunit [Candidatus Paceibacterota bacterium]|jgi:phage terminase small subunit|nr:terminase small subunit [Candidatus Paceibacterota bacterium]